MKVSRKTHGFLFGLLLLTGGRCAFLPPQEMLAPGANLSAPQHRQLAGKVMQVVAESRRMGFDQVLNVLTKEMGFSSTLDLLLVLEAEGISLKRVYQQALVEKTEAIRRTMDPNMSLRNIAWDLGCSIEELRIAHVAVENSWSRLYFEDLKGTELGRAFVEEVLGMAIARPGITSREIAEALGFGGGLEGEERLLVRLRAGGTQWEKIQKKAEQALMKAEVEAEKRAKRIQWLKEEAWRTLALGRPEVRFEDSLGALTRRQEENARRDVEEKNNRETFIRAVASELRRNPKITVIAAAKNLGFPNVDKFKNELYKATGEFYWKELSRKILLGLEKGIFDDENATMDDVEEKKEPPRGEAFILAAASELRAHPEMMTLALARKLGFSTLNEFNTELYETTGGNYLREFYRKIVVTIERIKEELSVVPHATQEEIARRLCLDSGHIKQILTNAETSLNALRSEALANVRASEVGTIRNELFTKPDLTQLQVAERLELEPSAVREAVASTGMTWPDFRRGILIERIRAELSTHPEMTLNDLAKELGFGRPQTLGTALIEGGSSIKKIKEGITAIQASL